MPLALPAVRYFKKKGLKIMEDRPNDFQIDWELKEDYYGKDSGVPEWRLEDFMDQGEPAPSCLEGERPEADERLQRTIRHVRQVLALAQEGKTTAQISQALGLEFQYVYDIQVTAQGFREDDEIAVAHMMCM